MRRTLASTATCNNRRSLVLTSQLTDSSDRCRMVAVAGLAGSRLQAPSLAGARVQTARRTAFKAVRTTTVAATTGSEYPKGWLPKDALVVGASVAGWVIPSNIPVAALGGQSLFGAFTQSIGKELSHFPTGPALGDKFWLYLVTWHVGLFLAMFLGQIGVQGRKQGYFD